MPPSRQVSLAEHLAQLVDAVLAYDTRLQHCRALGARSAESAELDRLWAVVVDAAHDALALLEEERDF